MSLRKIKHPKSSHYPKNHSLIKPYWIKRREVKHISWVGLFTEESKYPSITPENDWNKWCGLSSYPAWHSRKNSFMVAWRYNHDKETFQLMPYYHDTRGNTYNELSNHPIIDVPTDRLFFVDLYFDRRNKSVRCELRVLPTEIPFNDLWRTKILIPYDQEPTLSFTTPTGHVRPSWFNRTIRSYFGGDNPPTHKDVYLWKGRYWHIRPEGNSRDYSIENAK